MSQGEDRQRSLITGRAGEQSQERAVPAAELPELNDFDGMRHPLATGLIISNHGLRDEIKVQAKDLPLNVVLESDSMLEPGALREANLELLIIDASVPPEPLEQFIPGVKSITPDLLVAVIDPSRNSDLILRAVRSGADEVIVPPLAGGMRTALRHLQQKLGRNPAVARVLGLISAKGGCGGTTIACHLAAAMASVSNEHVLLADFDLDGGLVGFLMKTTTPYSILDAARNTHRLDVSFWKGLVASPKPRLDVIPAADRVAGDAPPVEQLRNVLRAVRSMYGWVVADLGNRLNALSTSLLDAVDELLVVMTPDLPAVYQAKQMAGRLLERGFPLSRAGTILNRATRGRDLDDREVRRLVGIDLQATVPDLPALEEFYAEGLLAAAGSGLGRSIADLAARKAGVPVAAGKRRRSLLNLVWAS